MLGCCHWNLPRPRLQEVLEKDISAPLRSATPAPTTVFPDCANSPTSPFPHRLASPYNPSPNRLPFSISSTVAAHADDDGEGHFCSCLACLTALRPSPPPNPRQVHSLLLARPSSPGSQGLAVQADGPSKPLRALPRARLERQGALTDPARRVVHNLHPLLALRPPSA